MCIVRLENDLATAQLDALALQLQPHFLFNALNAVSAAIYEDPRRADMRDVLNALIKRREPFRPFCPSILHEQVGEYFVGNPVDPFMITVYPIKPEKRSVIPAVTHVDGSGRLQTVHRETNPLYWQLLNAFAQRTGVPVLLNTSFNENEPIVCTPTEALECFLRTKMDVLVLGNYVAEKQ